MHIFRRYSLLSGFILLFLVACAGEETPSATMTTQPTQQPTSEEPQHLILATTTSVEDSGLMPYILPDFEQKFNADVSVIAVGTGQALAIGEAGDADALIVHAPEREAQFLTNGHGIERDEFAYNDFIIIGPADDPANIREATSAREAFTKIAEAQVTFVSRGDESGTHIKEREIWESTGIDPEGDWYFSAGQGMGTTLTMTEQLGAYTLTDHGTYLSRQEAGLALELLFQGDDVMFNLYSVLLVDPKKDSAINAELARHFADWLTSLETQQLINSFTVNDEPLFHPYSVIWRQSQPTGD